MSSANNDEHNVIPTPRQPVIDGPLLELLNRGTDAAETVELCVDCEPEHVDQVARRIDAVGGLPMRRVPLGDFVSMQASLPIGKVAALLESVDGIRSIGLAQRFTNTLQPPRLP